MGARWQSEGQRSPAIPAKSRRRERGGRTAHALMGIWSFGGGAAIPRPGVLKAGGAVGVLTFEPAETRRGRRHRSVRATAPKAALGRQRPEQRAAGILATAARFGTCAAVLHAHRRMRSHASAQTRQASAHASSWARCSDGSASVSRESILPVVSHISAQSRLRRMQRMRSLTDGSARHVSAQAGQAWAHSKHASVARCSSELAARRRFVAERLRRSRRRSPLHRPTHPCAYARRASGTRSRPRTALRGSGVPHPQSSGHRPASSRRT